MLSRSSVAAGLMPHGVGCAGQSQLNHLISGVEAIECGLHKGQEVHQQNTHKMSVHIQTFCRECFMLDPGAGRRRYDKQMNCTAL